MLRHISSVLWWLMFKPISVAYVLRRFVLSCICWCVWDRRARSSVKSRSSNFDVILHLMPLGLSLSRKFFFNSMHAMQQFSYVNLNEGPSCLAFCHLFLSAVKSVFQKRCESDMNHMSIHPVQCIDGVYVAHLHIYSQVKPGFQNHTDISYSRSCVHQMWITWVHFRH